MTKVMDEKSTAELSIGYNALIIARPTAKSLLPVQNNVITPY